MPPLTLILTSLFMVLGASMALAAKPPSSGNIKLISAPMLTNKTECSVLNVGQTDMLPVRICMWEQLNDGTLEPHICHPQIGDPPRELDPGKAYGSGSSGLVAEVPTYNDGLVHRVYCEVDYLGLPGDISGAFCGDLGCVPLQ